MVESQHTNNSRAKTRSFSEQYCEELLSPRFVAEVTKVMVITVSAALANAFVSHITNNKGKSR